MATFDPKLTLESNDAQCPRGDYQCEGNSRKSGPGAQRFPPIPRRRDFIIVRVARHVRKLSDRKSAFHSLQTAARRLECELTGQQPSLQALNLVRKDH